MSSADPFGKVKLYAIAIIPILLIAGMLLFMSYYQVNEGYVGVQKEWGAVQENELSPGANWIVPIQTSVQEVEIRPRTYTMSDSKGEGKKSARADAVPVQTVNGTTVRVDVTVRYHINPKNADQFVSDWYTVKQAEQRMIRPSVRSRLRTEAAGIKTTEIYTQKGRSRLAQAVRSELKSEFSDEAMVLEAVQIRDVNLPESYDKALNQKEIAKQRVQKKEYQIQQARKEAERQEIAAKGQARVIQIKGDALRKNPIVLRQRYIDAIRPTDKVILSGNQNSSTKPPVILDASNQSESSA